MILLTHLKFYSSSYIYILDIIIILNDLKKRIPKPPKSGLVNCSEELSPLPIAEWAEWACERNRTIDMS